MQHKMYIQEDLMQFYKDMCHNIKRLINDYYLVADDITNIKMESGLISQILLLEQFRKRFNLQVDGEFDEFLTAHNVDTQFNL